MEDKTINKLYHKEYSKKWRASRLEKELLKSKEYYLVNKVKISERTRLYYQANKVIINAKRKEYLQNNPKARISANLRTRLNTLLQGKRKHCKLIELISCTKQDLIDHLESQFKAGMSWDNYGMWHVDHIKPCNSFDLNNKDEQLKCFHYTNLQPLWAKDNLVKNKYYQKDASVLR